MSKSVYFLPVAVLLGLLSFAVTASARPATTLITACVVGVAAALFVRALGHAGHAADDLAAMLTAGAAIALGGLLKLITRAPGVGWPDALAILAGQGVAWAFEASTTSAARACFICKLAIDERVPFACPRCSQVICARPTCWIARHFRCRYCDEREVILFPIDEAWWAGRLGARVFDGTCSSCYQEGRECDLRSCGQCRWPMCRRCWDYHNGQCARCGWILPDLPPALRPFMAAGPGTGGGLAGEGRR